MGGDHAPAMVLEGLERTLEIHPYVRFLLFGPEKRLKSALAHHPRLAAVVQLRHAPDVIAMDEKPGQALRRGKDSSMRLAIDAVADGEASAIISAGNTGALMALSKFVLRTIPGVERPAIASFFPTETGETVLLDLGANVECDAENLVQFAIMGANFAHAVLGRVRPMVGLLNVGSEDIKGHETVRTAANKLRGISGASFDFYGFVEGDDITKGTVDVIVTDGFTGNVALKTAEGTARLIGGFLRAAFQGSFLAKLGYVFVRPALNALRERLDPRHYNGGVFLGLNGIVVKSHGGTDAVGFAAATNMMIDMVRDHLVKRIQADFSQIQAQQTAIASETAAQL